MPFYITVKMAPEYHQTTLEEFLFGTGSCERGLITRNVSNTRTYKRDFISPKIASTVDVQGIIKKLADFNKDTESLHCEDMSKFYETFYIPKRSGGLRKIDAPNEELSFALRRLKGIFEDIGLLYHTSAFAYIKQRSTVMSVKRHQTNQSKWFLKLDMHDFFGSTTKEFVMQQFRKVFPLCVVMDYRYGREELSKALDLCFLNGGLPQGTPISPFITNVMMIPFDYELSTSLRDSGNFVYTRYADDMLISSKYNFMFKDITNHVISLLSSMGAPFTLNTKKTRYQSSAGSNWNLGVMLNSDNEITVGHKKKKKFFAMLHNYVQSRDEDPMSTDELQYISGLHSYYMMVEPKYFEGAIIHFNQKNNVDVIQMLKDDIAGK